MFFNRLWIEMSEGPTEITVLRNGREILLTVEELGSGANAWAEFGVNWRPTSVGG